MSKKSEYFKKWWWIPVAVVFFWTIIAFLPFILDFESGKWGDTFGSVNALFSGLAFAILIITLYVQMEELALYRDELRQNRNEMRGQKRATQKETFERTFFQFLEMLDTKYHVTEFEYDHEIDEVSAVTKHVADIRKNLEMTGLEVVYPRLITRNNKHYLKVRAKGEDAFRSAVNEENWNRALYDMGSYFSLLYQILIYVEQTDFSDTLEEKKFYTCVLRDRMTNDELIAMFFIMMQPEWYIKVGHGNVDAAHF